MRGTAFGRAVCVAVVVLVVAVNSVAAQAPPVQPTPPAPKSTGPSATQMKDVSVYDRMPAETTHHMMRVTLGRSRAVETDQPVVAVTVDKPKRLSVFISGPRTLNVLGRQEAGIAHFVAKDKDGKVVMARDVFVGDKFARYVRIRDVCGEGASGPSCGREQLYFCPDQCFEMSVAGTQAAAKKP